MKKKIANIILYLASFALCCSLSIIVNQLFSEYAIIVAAIVAPISFIIAVIIAVKSN